MRKELYPSSSSILRLSREPNAGAYFLMYVWIRSVWFDRCIINGFFQPNADRKSCIKLNVSSIDSCSVGAYSPAMPLFQRLGSGASSSSPTHHSSSGLSDFTRLKIVWTDFVSWYGTCRSDKISTFFWIRDAICNLCGGSFPLSPLD